VDLAGVGGVYVASLLIAVISGVFPLVNAELYLIGLTVTLGYSPQLFAIAAILALGQTLTHSVLFQTARGVTSLGAKRRVGLEAKLARVRERLDRWRDKVLVVLCAAATIGLPPMMLVSLCAGSLAIRFRTFVVIGLAGRLVRFGTLALIAQYL
jgi:membrane protein YqaA with SNARE-associated domain